MSTSPLQIPGRVRAAQAALDGFGDRARVFIEALAWTDPLADAVVADIVRLGRGRGMRMIHQALSAGVDTIGEPPASFRALFAELDAPPAWLDRDLLDLASRAYCSHPITISVALGTASLVGSYVNGAAVAPMALTRRFTDQGSVRALETANWLWSAARPGGLERFAPGLAATVRVRLIHAFVRHDILTDHPWDSAELGHPVNQADSAYTLIEFSLIPLRVMGAFGVPHTAGERSAIFHLFRYVGHLMGVDERILPRTEAEFADLERLYHLTGAVPSDYSRELVAELLDTIMPTQLAGNAGPLQPLARRILRPMMHGLAYRFTGPDTAALLSVSPTSWRHLPTLLAPLVRLFNLAQRAIPGEQTRKLARSLRFIDTNATTAATRLGVTHDLVDAAP
jgi:hypothetical protein